MASQFGRKVVAYKVNKSGGSVAAGDVLVPDTSNDNAFTTTTTAAVTTGAWVADEAIASNATGRVVISGHVTLINVSASVTRGHTGTTHTVAKQAVSTGGTSRVAGTFCKFTTGGTTPEADIWPVDLGAGSGLTDPMTTRGDIIVRNSSNATARLGVGAANTALKSDGTDASWGTVIQTTKFASVYNSATQSRADGSVILFDSEVEDTSAMHDTGSNTGRLTAPTSGVYAITIGGLVSVTNPTVKIRKNGTTLVGPAINPGVGQFLDGFAMLRLAATDYIEFIHNTGTVTYGHASAFEAQTQATMTLIGL